MKPKFTIKTAEQLRSFRKRTGLNQYEFAEKIGISRSYLCKKEIAERPILPEDGKRINSLTWKLKY